MGADVPGAHALLATIEPASVGPALLEPVLDALLKGAGASRGFALDASSRCQPAARGLDPSRSRSAELALGLCPRERPRRELRRGAPRADVRRKPPPAGAPSFDPRILPLTAGDDTLAWIALEQSPADPVGFASVAAHAASLLAWVRMSEKVREADFELKYRVWELESLYDVGLSIAGTLDLESLADDILMKSVSLLNARSGTLVVRPGASPDGELRRSSSGASGRRSSTREPRRTRTGASSSATAGRTGPPALAAAPAEKLLAVPISSDGRPLGLLVVADKENRAGGIDDFGPADARILSLFGNQAAIALENARLHRESVEKEKMEREIEIAASIQRAILPTTLPAVSGILLAAGNRPTKQVGGDFYDVYPLPDGRVAFCVADVSGKGIPAALLVSTVHACIHLLMEAGASDLTGLVARINRHLGALLGDPQVRHPLRRGLRPVRPEPPVRQRGAQPRDLALGGGRDAPAERRRPDRDVRDGAPGREPRSTSRRATSSSSTPTASRRRPTRRTRSSGWSVSRTSSRRVGPFRRTS